MSTKTSVAHLSSVHQRNDVRIFLKECRSLAAAGHEVSLVVADGKGDERIDNVQLIDVGGKSGRLNRIFAVSRRILARALELNAQVYHIHDPELLTIAGKLKRNGKIVIFDAHEDVSLQLLSKPYLHPMLSPVIARAYSTYESMVCRKLDAIVTATPSIRDKFLQINPNSIDINNYPMLDELWNVAADGENRADQVCFVGGMSEIRGIREIVQAMELVQPGIRLKLCGTFSDRSLETDVRTYPGWGQVDELGWQDRNSVGKLLGESAAGLVVYQPLPNHITAQPNKMFEYMSAGLPVIASKFPLWEEIIEGNECGICVDPNSPQEIAKAIDSLVADPAQAAQMGRNGRKAVEQQYNWMSEKTKLVNLYEQLGLNSTN